ncbi:hypothetical protein ACLKA6_001684 [Drosophila palustris]
MQTRKSLRKSNNDATSDQGEDPELRLSLRFRVRQAGRQAVSQSQFQTRTPTEDHSGSTQILRANVATLDGIWLLLASAHAALAMLKMHSLTPG